MQKDFKIYHHRGLKFGCATVKYSIEDWIDREGKGKNAGEHLETYFNNFRRNFGLDFLFINRKKKDKRYLIINNCTFEKILVQEHDFKEVNYKGLIYYSINVALSRKIMMPIVQKTIDKFYKKIKEREQAKEQELKRGITIKDISKELKRIK